MINKLFYLITEEKTKSPQQILVQVFWKPTLITLGICLCFNVPGYFDLM